GDRYLFDETGEAVALLRHGDGPGWPEAAHEMNKVIAGLQPLSARPRPAVRQGIAYLPTLPRVTLLLVGGGHGGRAGRGAPPRGWGGRWGGSTTARSPRAPGGSRPRAATWSATSARCCATWPRR